MNLHSFNPHRLLLACFVGLLATPTLGTSADATAFRPPAVPLVAHDPYFSVWSQSDNLWAAETTHWTGKPQRMSAIVRVDGHAYRLMGGGPQTIAAMKQISVEVLPTRTVYHFAGGGVQVRLMFTTPALPMNIEILSRPTTYINCEVSAVDEKTHEVEFYFDAGGELATNEGNQKVTGETIATSNAAGLKLGSVTQQVLGKSGDDLRIDWGYLYVTAPRVDQATAAFGSADKLRDAFAEAGPAAITSDTPRFPVAADRVVAAIAMTIGSVGSEPVSRYALIAYDDLYSIEFMTKKLRPYWRKDGWEAQDLIEAAVNEHAELEIRCAEFDAELMSDLKSAGGQKYADIGALAFRQCFAAGKFVADANGQPLQFSKENHSNGCIATSDVFYPMMPQFLLFGPSLTKSVLVPFMDYAASDRWPFPFAPHDLGTYPKANGQVYGGGETNETNQMQVEESGNMLILFGALAKMEGNADFAGLYWDELTQWAEYLEKKGYDLDNQLSTDDFSGHLAHNVNLSAKAICGLGSYAMMCQMRGDDANAQKYADMAHNMVQDWMKAANDGDHYRLAFDRSGTWSQKYNLVWDRILELDLFPAEVADTEMAYYRKIQNKYGLPLDNRSDYTKLDWILWSATLTEDRDDFLALIGPVHEFLNATPDRSPMTDWYFTSTAKKRGFTARPVVGGVFLKLLYDSAVWSKDAAMDETQASDWAPMPLPRETRAIVPTSANANVKWKYTFEKPTGAWQSQDYTAENWKEGMGGFGTNETPGTTIATKWNSSDIWIRRTFQIDGPIPAEIALRMYHDEDAQVYLNGKLVADVGGFSGSYQLFEIPSSALRQGENVMAIHCHQSTGGQYIDAGIDELLPEKADAKTKD
ncbi:glutaminase family protein [Allorhodopirellula heiligendammensis]|uniref:Glutaminase A n=1 Tax=Allorhodopirellula heiligendammensis TaxID=2714739 RepID=A0A5C6BTY4_9BACT|nr:glutaminase family protein [Allorhodopirellula heiligendammensis]TWU15693.1 hypothetical protein Poly21_28900 [Allorhodopirellula heiligendammensis]